MHATQGSASRETQRQQRQSRASSFRARTPCAREYGGRAHTERQHVQASGYDCERPVLQAEGRRMSTGEAPWHQRTYQLDAGREHITKLHTAHTTARGLSRQLCAPGNNRCAHATVCAKKTYAIFAGMKSSIGTIGEASLPADKQPTNSTCHKAHSSQRLHC